MGQHGPSVRLVATEPIKAGNRTAPFTFTHESSAQTLPPYRTTPDTFVPAETIALRLHQGDSLNVCLVTAAVVTRVAILLH